MNEMLIVSSVGLWLMLSLNLLLTLAVIRRVNKQAEAVGGGTRESGLAKGATAPDFKATTLSGQAVTLASYAGRSVAFLFISPGCDPCRDGLPRYLSWHRQALPLGVDMVLVSAADAQETQPLVEEFSIDMPVLLAPRGASSFLADYKVPGTPHYTLVDSQGIVVSADYPGYDWHSWAGAAQATSTPPATLVASEA